MEQLIGWLLILLVALTIVRFFFKHLPGWLLGTIAVLLMLKFLHPDVIRQALAASSDTLEALAVLFFVLLGLKIMVKGFNGGKKD